MNYIKQRGIRLLVEPVAERVEKTALPEVSAKGSGQEIFPLHGVTCRLRVGRWQIGGKAEAWEYGMDAGKTLSCPGTARVHPSLWCVMAVLRWKRAGKSGV